MERTNPPGVTILIWAVLALALAAAIVLQRWSVAFVSASALVLTFLPTVFVSRFDVRLPRSFLAAISVFVFGTLFLGEVFDFYERYWWWDVALHGTSAVGFGLIGFLFVFFLFEGDRFAAPPIAVGFIAFCFGVTIGAVWEIFEFAMDQIFGLNMQKSGLIDTMWDLIVDCLGAFVGASAGVLYLKGRREGWLNGPIVEFIRLNRRFFRKSR